MSSIVDLIKADHQAVSDLFSQYKNDISDKGQVAEEICDALELHAKAEEEVLYPLLPDDFLDYSLDEHQGIKYQVAAVRRTNAQSEDEILKLEELVIHHVEEEEGPGGTLEWAADNLDVNALGVEFESIKGSAEK